MSQPLGRVYWLTGISGSGKTTLGKKLAHHLKEKGKKVEYLDGDQVRDFFENDLGYERKDRIFNIRRLTFAVHLLSKHSVDVVVANIAPYFEVRDFIRKKLPSYTQIYVECSVEEAMKRDVKGLYKNRKQSSPLVGLDDVYEIPRNPDLVVQTDQESIEQSFQKMIKHLGLEK